MRSIACLAGICLFVLNGYAQDRAEIWLGAGIKREIFNDLTAGFQTNARISTTGTWQTLFQEVSLKSEHIKWFRPSIDYRFIASHEDNGNTVYGNRLNFNADFRHKISDFKFGARGRYQIFLGDFVLTGTDLDPSFRIKPYVAWEIPDTRFTPEFSTEFFYNPQNGPTGDRFNRVRYGLSLNIDLPNSQELGLTYYYGRRFNTGNPYNEHLFSIEWSYEWKTDEQKAKKKKKKSDDAPTIRDL